MHRRLQTFVFNVMSKREDGIGQVRWRFKCLPEEFDEASPRRKEVLEFLRHRMMFGKDTMVLFVGAGLVERAGINPQTGKANPTVTEFRFEVKFTGGPHPENFHAYPAQQVVDHIKTLHQVQGFGGAAGWEPLKRLGIMMQGGAQPAAAAFSPPKPFGQLGQPNAAFGPLGGGGGGVAANFPETSVVWTLESSEQDITQASAPPGVNKHAWQQAINTAQMMTEEDTGGGGQKYNPHVVRGFKGLAHRVKSQELTIQAQEAQLKALSEKVEMIRSEQHTLDMEIKEITDENARLTQDILHNLRAPSQVNHHKDLELRRRLEAMERDLSDPHHALGQLQDLIAKHELQDPTDDLAVGGSLIPAQAPPVINSFIQHLGEQQKGIDAMVDTIKSDSVTLDVLRAPQESEAREFYARQNAGLYAPAGQVFVDPLQGHGHWQGVAQMQ